MIAQNTNTPASALERLSQDESVNVRRNVARNKNTPLSVLKILLHDRDRSVREGLAKKIRKLKK